MRREPSSARPHDGAVAIKNVIAPLWTTVAHHAIRLLRGALIEDTELLERTDSWPSRVSGLRSIAADHLLTTTTDVLFLTSGNDLGRIAARRLAAAFPDLKIVVEHPLARSTLLRRRVKRLGALHVAGQMAFMA